MRKTKDGKNKENTDNSKEKTAVHFYDLQTMKTNKDIDLTSLYFIRILFKR